VVAFIVQAKAWTYLRNKDNSNDNNRNGNSNGEKLIPYGDDNKKNTSNCALLPVLDRFLGRPVSYSGTTTLSFFASFRRKSSPVPICWFVSRYGVCASHSVAEIS
jgi:hypothetical protein